MIPRKCIPSKTNSFFLFGARGTGKSSLLKAHFAEYLPLLWIDLLRPREEARFSSDPQLLAELISNELKAETRATTTEPLWVVIDEVQQVPQLLNEVHHQIEVRQGKVLFALSGSSARKLKRGAANLLAGRAFVYNLFPFLAQELGQRFELEAALRFGTLPKIFNLASTEDKILYLEAYADTYLKEEILSEQVVRNLAPFSRFLTTAAQCSGQIVNYRKIGKDLDLDPKTVTNYFLILEDTLIGFFLPAYERSARRSFRHSPKFYLFDIGVKRAIDGSLRNEHVSAQERGVLFEHFLTCEIFRLNRYLREPFQISFVMTKDDVEVDLVLEHRASKKKYLIEIKSTEKVIESHLKSLALLAQDFPDAVRLVFSRDPYARELENVSLYPWEAGLTKLFNG